MNDQHMGRPPGHTERIISSGPGRWYDLFTTHRRATLYCERTGERWAVVQQSPGCWLITLEVQANRACRHAYLKPGDDLDSVIRAVRAMGRRSMMGAVS